MSTCFVMYACSWVQVVCGYWAGMRLLVRRLGTACRQPSRRFLADSDDNSLLRPNLYHENNPVY